MPTNQSATIAMSMMIPPGIVVLQLLDERLQADTGCTACLPADAPQKQGLFLGDELIEDALQGGDRRGRLRHAACTAPGHTRAGLLRRLNGGGALVTNGAGIRGACIAAGLTGDGTSIRRRGDSRPRETV